MNSLNLIFDQTTEAALNSKLETYKIHKYEKIEGEYHSLNRSHSKGSER